MVHSSYRESLNKDKSHLSIPEVQLYWSKNLARGTIFMPEKLSKKHSAVRPTGGIEIYYCDLGTKLIVTAKERSGEIRAVSYINVDNSYNQNIWTLESEFTKQQALSLFQKARRSLGLDDGVVILEPETKQKDAA